MSDPPEVRVEASPVRADVPIDDAARRALASRICEELQQEGITLSPRTLPIFVDRATAVVRLSLQAKALKREDQEVVAVLVLQTIFVEPEYGDFIDAWDPVVEAMLPALVKAIFLTADASSGAVHRLCERLRRCF